MGSLSRAGRYCTDSGTSRIMSDCRRAGPMPCTAGERANGAYMSRDRIKQRYLTLACCALLQSCALAAGVGLAVLKEDSPSCGTSFVYDGTFSRRQKEGRGVLTALLERHDIPVFSELEIDRAAACLRALDEV